jgi:hypothetical protein
MPDVLIVAARELGDPVAFSVLVVAGDRSLHRLSRRTRLRQAIRLAPHGTSRVTARVSRTKCCHRLRSGPAQLDEIGAGG